MEVGEDQDKLEEDQENAQNGTEDDKSRITAQTINFHRMTEHSNIIKPELAQTYSSHPYCGPSSHRECAVGATRIGLVPPNLF